jgi:hypothetical protein
MVSVEQYRAVVGRFSGGCRVRKRNNSTTKGVTISQNNGGAVKKLAFIIIILLLSGDIELNPGPSTNSQDLLLKVDQLKKFLTKRQNDKKAISEETKKELLRNVTNSLNILKKNKNPPIFTRQDYEKILLDQTNKRLQHVKRNLFNVNLKLLDVHKEILDDDNRIYRDDEVMVFIKRIKFARQKNFALVDYQYQVKVLQTDQSASSPLFKNVIVNIHMALNDIVKELQKQLDPSKHSQIYFCFLHNDLPGNVNTGNYALFNTNANTITGEVMTRLASILRSYQFIKLDSSFQVIIKVLSVDHVNHRIQKGNIRFRDMVGSKRKLKIVNILSNETLQSMFTIPEDDDRFKNKCLPGAVILGFFHARYCKHIFDQSCHEDAQTYRIIKRCNETISKQAKQNHAGRARNKLFNLIQRLLFDLGYDSNGPFEMREFLSKAAEKLNVRFHVYSNQGNKRIYMLPFEFNDQKPQIYLYYESYENGISHISLILKLNSFMKNVGYPCLYCEKIRFSNYHYCSKAGISCFSCRRINLRSPLTYVDYRNNKSFCRKLPTTTFIKTVCEQCNVPIFTTDCETRHKKNIRACNRGFFCKVCKTYNLRVDRKMTIEQCKSGHVCFQELCKLCYQYYEPGNIHYCRMVEQKSQHYMKNLAFFDLESFTGTGIEACTNCYEIEQKFMLNHKTKVLLLSNVRKRLQPQVGNVNVEDVECEIRFFSHFINQCFFDEEFVCHELSHNQITSYKKYFSDFEHSIGILKRSEVLKLIEINVLEKEHVRCHMHLDMVKEDVEIMHIPNYAVLYYESKQHGEFNRIDFADPKMNHNNDCCIRPLALHMPYLPESVNKLLNVKKVASSGYGKYKGSNTKFPLDLKCGLEEELGSTNIAGNGQNFLDNECLEDDMTDEEDVETDEEEEEGEDDEDLCFSENEKHITVKQGNKSILGKVPDLDSLKQFNVMDKFLLFICNDMFRNFVFLSHNGSAYDMQFLCKVCYSHGISPKLITRDMRILQLTIPTFNITFIDSMQYISGSLDSLTKTFHLGVSKGFFPHNFNVPENYEYDGECPSLSAFDSFNDSEDAIKSKLSFVNKLKSEQYKWNFKHEISEYCNQDVNVLCQAMCIFLKQAIYFQEELFLRLENERMSQLPTDSHKILLKESTKLPFLHPFTPPFLTLSGWVFGVWKICFLPLYEIYALKDDKGFTSIPVSEAEHEIVAYKKWRHPTKQILSSFTSVKPPRFGKISPDFFIPETKKAYWVHGCYYHAHRIQDGCLEREKHQAWADEGTKNFTGNSFAAEQLKFNRHKKILNDRYGIRYKNQKVYWTCGWSELKNKSIEDLPPHKRDKAARVQEFMKLYYQNRPLARLAPRVALRGGKVESFVFSWKKSDHAKEDLLYFDYNSLYPSVSSNPKNPFPVGKPIVCITQEDISLITFQNGQCMYGKEMKIPVKGLAQAKVISPQLLIPFLQYR